MKGPKQIWLGVTFGIRGYFAVLYDNDGPITSGIGSYDNPFDAACEAESWHLAEDIPLDNYTKGLLYGLHNEGL